MGPKGLFDSSVYTVADGELAAVVSDLPQVDKLRPERRHLAAHQGVLSEAIEKNSVVLPVSFGTVADSPEGIKKLLSKYQKDFLREIKRIEGRVEMELRLTWEVPNVFEYFVANHPELKEVRDRIYDGKHEPTRDEKIELGQAFERILEQERENLTGKVEKIISPVCAEMKRNKCRNEHEVMRLACLIGKDDKERFEAAVNEASEMFDDNYTFEFNGPFPPYNFIEVRLKI